jgi:GNAT superfamily N-acetyltransferase
MSGLSFKPVDRTIWQDFEALFESRGAPHYCWCMAWRRALDGSHPEDKAQRKAAMHGLVEADVPVGIVGYREGKPVAWCSIAPCTTYRPLGGASDPGEADDAVWSVVCFFVKRELRGRRFTARLLAAAADYARSQRATAIEGYPVDPDSPSYRAMGFVSTFEAAGFAEAGMAGTRRHVMRKTLR